MPTRKKLVGLGILIPQDLNQKLKQYARKTGKTKGCIIRSSLMYFFNTPLNATKKNLLRKNTIKKIRIIHQR